MEVRAVRDEEGPRRVRDARNTNTPSRRVVYAVSVQCPGVNAKNRNTSGPEACMATAQVKMLDDAEQLLVGSGFLTSN